MSATNPQFQQVSRAAYELPALLRKLGEADYSTPLTDENLQTVGAIQSHAYNAVEAIAGGMAAIGQMMTFVGQSEYQLEDHQLSDLGSLIMHLAVEVEHLHEVESDMQVRIDQSDRLGAASTKGKGGGAGRRGKDPA